LILFSGTYVDSICILSILGYKFGLIFLDYTKIQNEALVRISKNEDLNNQRFQELANEIVKVKNSSEGLKAAINLTAKR
jgi:hypothetical protein